MKKKIKKSVLGHLLAIITRTAFICTVSQPADMFFKTVERFLLVCSSMTAGCSVTLEFK